MPLVFMYGPDTLQGRMFDRIGPSDFIGSATLADHELVFNKPNMKNRAEGLPNIQPAEDQNVFGIVFDLKPRQIELLEGFFGGYEQRGLRVGIGEGEDQVTRKTGVWIARRVKSGLKPSKSVIETTRKGMEENSAAQTFIDALKEFEVLDE